MRLPTWYLAVGIALPPFLVFLLVTPLVDPPFRAFSTVGVPGPRPRLVLIRYADMDYGPVLVLYNTAEIISRRMELGGVLEYRHATIGTEATERLMQRLNLDSLVSLAGTYERERNSHAPYTVLLFWKGGEPHGISVYGDPTTDYPQREIPALVDSALAIVGRYEPAGLVPWQTHDSTAVFYAISPHAVTRKWPAAFPRPNHRLELTSYVPIPASIAPAVSSFMASKRPGEQYETLGRSWAIFVRPRLPGEQAFTW